MLSHSLTSVSILTMFCSSTCRQLSTGCLVHGKPKSKFRCGFDVKRKFHAQIQKDYYNGYFIVNCTDVCLGSATYIVVVPAVK